MSDDEVDELLKAVDTSSGEISYTGMSLKRELVMPRVKLICEYRPRPYDSGQLIISRYPMFYDLTRIARRGGVGLSLSSFVLYIGVHMIWIAIAMV
jgi:hypothetical protein